ncbi:MAG: type IV secretory system conjugative DNA transfer family protein [Sporichthyaceae bacterium]
MAKNQARASTSRDDAILIVGALALLALVVAGAYVSLQLAARVNGRPAPPGDPVELAKALADGRVRWDGAATVIAIVIAVAAGVLFMFVAAVISRSRENQVRCDRAVAHMANAKDLRPMTAPARARKNRQLGADTDAPGVPIAKALLPPRGRSRPMVYGSWEDMLVMIAGPRTNKTTAYAIPALLAAPGAALLTSNKRDVLDATRDLRAKRGQVWVFDPQRVAGAEATWWWNPLSYIAPRDPGTGMPVADESKAGKLAAQLVASATKPGARMDAYFDAEKENLLALLLLAAACGERPLTAVYSWLTDPTDSAPADLLAEHGFGLHEATVYKLAHLPDKQREGVYGGARQVMAFLLDRSIARWITPPPGDASENGAPGRGLLPEFDPRAYARSTDTLYLLSRKDETGAAPLVAALTVAVTEALEDRATGCPGGRLPVPFVGILDEAANVCRLKHLDSHYSHYGSRGIILFTILQNWAQGEEVWGAAGMEKLWSAANIRIYGGGVDDDRFLRRLSDLIGPYEHVARSESRSHGSRQRSRAVIDKTILTVSELRELPPGRAVMFASGTPAALLEPQPWFHGPDAAAIQASIDAHNPTTVDSSAANPAPSHGDSTPEQGRLPGPRLRRAERRP